MRKYKRNKSVRVYSSQHDRFILVRKPVYKMGHIYVDTQKGDYFIFKKREYVFDTWVYLIEWMATKYKEVLIEEEITRRLDCGFVKLYHKPRKDFKKVKENNMLQGELFRI